MHHFIAGWLRLETVSGKESYEERQQQLCLEVFQAAEIGKDDVSSTSASGAENRTSSCRMRASSGRLIGFNISERQVRYANERAQREHLAHKLLYRPGEAERLPGIEGLSVDRALAIECAFYFERPRFYERAAQVLKPAHTFSFSRPAKDGAWVSKSYLLEEEFTARWPATSPEAKPQVGSRP